MKEKVLLMLKQSQSYVSGQEMCNALGVSRTAVWKVINQLKEEGYVIEAVSNKGYSLSKTPNTITEYEVRSHLEDSAFLDQIVSYEVIDSTNVKAKQLANEGKNQNLLVLAEEQTAGRGRRGRGWSSPKGSGIWMSLLLHPQIAPQNASMLTLVSALALVKAIKEVTQLEAQIKWPNDIILNGKKVCGILTEMSSEVDYIHYVVIGIGINANTTEFPEEIQPIATSLQLAGNKEVNRAELVAVIMKHFERYYERFIKTEDMRELQEEYNNSLVHKNQNVKIINGSTITEGIARGIDTDGSLLVELEEGRILPVISGEVSVRGMNGYV